MNPVDMTDISPFFSEVFCLEPFPSPVSDGARDRRWSHLQAEVPEPDFRNLENDFQSRQTAQLSYPKRRSGIRDERTGADNEKNLFQMSYFI